MTPLADAAARALAGSEFARPVAIEAGAGTGKTRTLVARVGTWLLGPGWQAALDELAAEHAARGASPPAPAEVAARACEGVVAITFTDAAAAEMAARVDRLLAQAAAGAGIEDLESPPAGLAAGELAARGEALLAAAGRLRVSTIHGFCHRLLAEHPFEAGLHPGFEIDADGERAAELATEVVLARLRADDPEIVALLASGVDPPELVEALRELTAAGVEAGELERDPFAGDVLARRFAELDAATVRVAELAAPLAAGRRVASIDDGLAALDRLRAQLGEHEGTVAGLAALAEPLAAAAEDARKIVRDWAKGNFGKTEQAGLGAEVDDLEQAASAVAAGITELAELDPELLRLARRALGSLLGELAARRRAAGVTTFDDLLERAARLLAERRDVRDRVRRGIRQLLVDEFQDTDRRQCELLRQLVLADSDAPAPGLFLVGDPKQSIYGWRSADLAAYSAFLAELAAAGGLAERLAVNFRSAPPVLAEIERALAGVLIDEPGLQAPFQPLLACPARAADRGFEAEQRAAVEYWRSHDSERRAAGAPTTAARAAELEAAALAGDVRGLVERGAAGWRDFAILLRARGDLDTYLDALRRAGVPYVVQKDRSYFRRREVIDAVAAVRAILDPDDLLALVAFLRSPFVGVPDAAWLPLWRAGLPAALIELDGERGLEAALEAVRRAAAEPAVEGSAAPELWAESLAAAVRDLAALRAEFRALPAGAWVERLRARLQLEPIAAARFLGRFGLANLERLFAELESRLAAEPDPARALATLRAAVAEEREAEEARPPGESDDAVSVMTIHTAKGLQFRHVYLVQAHKQSGGGRNAGRERFAFGPVEADGAGGRRREMKLFGAPTPGWREVERRRRRVAAAETARLLYVATTRAIDRLVICGLFDGGDRRRRPDDAPPSFAELLAPRIADGADETAPTRDAHGVLWRAAADGGAIGRPAAVRPAALPPPADRAELHERRLAAAARSARPRTLPASKLARADEPFDFGDDGGERAQARAAGVALHRALELAPLAAADDPAWREAARRALRDSLPAAGANELAALDAHLDRLLGSNLWRELARLEGAVLARELPLVAAADPAATAGPLDAYVGTLDLLYRDPESGETVIADFKSDQMDDDGAAAKLDRYRPQLELYARAVGDALALDRPPRLELWLLALDRIIPLPTSGNR